MPAACKKGGSRFEQVSRRGILRHPLTSSRLRAGRTPCWQDIMGDPFRGRPHARRVVDSRPAPGGGTSPRRARPRGRATLLVVEAPSDLLGCAAPGRIWSVAQAALEGAAVRSSTSATPARTSAPCQATVKTDPPATVKTDPPGPREESARS